MSRLEFTTSRLASSSATTPTWRRTTQPGPRPSSNEVGEDPDEQLVTVRGPQTGDLPGLSDLVADLYRRAPPSARTDTPPSLRHLDDRREDAMTASVPGPDPRFAAPTGYPYLAATWLLARIHSLPAWRNGPASSALTRTNRTCSLTRWPSGSTRSTPSGRRGQNASGSYSPPRDEARYDAWDAAGPARNPAAD